MRFSTSYKKILLAAALLISGHSHLFSQMRYYLSMEGGGPAGWYSVNAGKNLLQIKDANLSLSAGVSSLHFRDFKGNFNPEFQIPVGLQLHGNKKHSYVLGGGTVLSSQVRAVAAQSDAQRTLHLNYYIKCGYLFSVKNNGFSLFYSPLFEYDGHIRQWGGFSFTRFFSVKK